MPVTYLAARSLASARAAFIAAALVALSPLLVWYSQEARAYSLFGLFSALSFLFFARAKVTSRRGDLVAWAVTSAVALTTHYFAGFLVAVEAVWLARSFGRGRAAVMAVLFVGAVEVALLPLLAKQHSSRRADALIRSTSLSHRLTQMFAWFAAADGRSTAALALAGMCACLGFAFLLRQRLSQGREALGVALGALMLPLLLALAGVDYFFFGNLLDVWVPLAVALAVGLATSRLGLLAALGLCAAFLSSDIGVFVEPNLQRDNWRAVAAVINSGRRTDAIVVYPDWDSQPLRYYSSRLSIPSNGEKVHSFLFVGVSSQFAEWKDPLRLSLRIPPGFHQISAYRIQHFIIRRFQAQTATTATITQLGHLVSFTGPQTAGADSIPKTTVVARTRT